jgi:hypothetical protein
MILYQVLILRRNAASSSSTAEASGLGKHLATRATAPQFLAQDNVWAISHPKP